MHLGFCRSSAGEGRAQTDSIYTKLFRLGRSIKYVRTGGVILRRAPVCMRCVTRAYVLIGSPPESSWQLVVVDNDRLLPMLTLANVVRNLVGCSVLVHVRIHVVCRVDGISERLKHL